MTPPAGHANAILTTGGFRCTVCGASEPAPSTPLPLTEHLRILRAFAQAHASCTATPIKPADLPPMPVAVPAFKRGDKVLFPHKNREKPGTVDKLSEPHGLELLIKYHGGNFIWRRASACRHAEPASLPTS